MEISSSLTLYSGSQAPTVILEATIPHYFSSASNRRSEEDAPDRVSRNAKDFLFTPALSFFASNPLFRVREDIRKPEGNGKINVTWRPQSASASRPRLIVFVVPPVVLVRAEVTSLLEEELGVDRQPADTPLRELRDLAVYKVGFRHSSI